jgi:secondary thiamine-phosphate synthase enzyme
MKSIVLKKTLITSQETQMINITDIVHQSVESSGIQSGTVFVLSMHTTTGLTVNEGLPDLERDITAFLNKIVKDLDNYHHARFLHEDGEMAINAPSHIRGALLGFEAYFPIDNGKIVCGGRQTVYFVELDGPQERSYVIHITGME